MDPIRDLRKYSRQTSIRLILGLFLLLAVVGLGLIYLFWGKGAALTGLLCLGAALLPVLTVVGALWLIDIINRKARNE